MSMFSVVVAMVLVGILCFAVASWQHGPLGRPALLMVLGEAVVLTLVGALWFGSVGSGAWWLVFPLIGVLVSGAERGLRSALLRSAPGPEMRGFLVGVAKYLVAGALLAWRLS